MYKILLGIWLFLLASKITFAISVDHLEDGTVVLRETSYVGLEEQVKNVVLWGKARGEDYLIPQMHQEKNSELYVANVSPILPLHTRTIYRKQFSVSGPNCLNAVLIDLGFLRVSRYVSGNEFNEHMQECKKISTQEQPNPGDIGTLSSKDDGIFHAFIYVSEQLIAQKESGFIDTRFELQLRENMLEFFGSTSGEIDYYRCQAKPFADQYSAGTFYKDLELITQSQNPIRLELVQKLAKQLILGKSHLKPAIYESFKYQIDLFYEAFLNQNKAQQE